VTGAIVVIVVLVVVLLVRAASGSTATSYDAIARRGVPARGILLSVASRANSTVGLPQRRFQLRDVVIEVEVPGQEPYEVSATPYIPTNLVRDVLPGATVELRVDPKNPNQIVIVGPGVGFNASLLNATSSQGTS
jgi:hypothetical protein